MDNIEEAQGGDAAGVWPPGGGGQTARIEVSRRALTRMDLVAILLQRYETEHLSGVVEISFHGGFVKKVSQTEVLKNHRQKADDTGPDHRRDHRPTSAPHMQ